VRPIGQLGDEREIVMAEAVSVVEVPGVVHVRSRERDVQELLVVGFVTRLRRAVRRARQEQSRSKKDRLAWRSCRPERSPRGVELPRPVRSDGQLRLTRCTGWESEMAEVDVPFAGTFITPGIRR
jgi:hypothetical protein